MCTWNLISFSLFSFLALSPGICYSLSLSIYVFLSFSFSLSNVPKIYRSSERVTRGALIFNPLFSSHLNFSQDIFIFSPSWRISSLSSSLHLHVIAFPQNKITAGISAFFFSLHNACQGNCEEMVLRIIVRIKGDLLTQKCSSRCTIVHPLSIMNLY